MASDAFPRRSWLEPIRAFLREEDWTFAPHERPTIPGSPGAPDHPRRRQFAYAGISALVGVTGGLGNALVSVNLPQLQGGLGLDPADIAWLPTVYVMTNTSINLLLVKFRQQFGLRPFALVFVGIYTLLTLLHLFAAGFASAILVRAASGMAAAALSSLGLYYMMQAFPARWRLKGLALGIALPQCATPLARVFSSDLLAMSQWRTLYLFELGLSLLSLAAVAALPLPPTEKRPAFERADFATFALYATGVGLIAAVLGEGRYLWWTNAAWMGWALAAACPLLAAALIVEHRRANPLLNLRWLGSADIVRFTIVTLMARVVLSEQTYAAVGLLNVLGQNNDQMRTLFAVVTLASILGAVMSAVTIDPDRLAHPVMLAIALVAVAAYVDSQATSLTRAPQMFVTQSLIAFAGSFFLGPSLLFGMTRALKEGYGHVVTFIALFGIINGLGTLAGSALLGSYQVIREKANSSALVQAIDPTDPIVTQRLAAGGAGIARVLGDPALRAAEGGAILSQATTREANVLAYDDVFRLVALLAGLTTAYLAGLLGVREWRLLRARPVAA